MIAGLVNILSGATLGASVAVIVAQDAANGVNVEGWAGPAANLGAVGAVIWFAYYLISKTVPSMMERYQDDFKAQRDLYAAESAANRLAMTTAIESQREEAKQTREAFLTSMREIQQGHDEQLAHQREDFNNVLERREAHYAQLLERVLAMKGCRQTSQEPAGANAG